MYYIHVIFILKLCAVEKGTDGNVKHPKAHGIFCCLGRNVGYSVITHSLRYLAKIGFVPPDPVEDAQLFKGTAIFNSQETAGHKSAKQKPFIDVLVPDTDLT